MTSTAATLTLATAARRRRDWFRQTGRPAAGPARWAALLTALDAVAAIGFAGGLALALTALPRGLAAAAPGAVLMAAGGLGRGLLAGMAATSGAAAAARVKTAVRGRIVRATVEARPGARPALGEAMALAVEGVEALDGYFGRFAPAKAASLGGVLIVLAAMALASPLCAAIALATFAPFILAMALAGSSAAGEQRRQFAALSRLSGLFADRVRALPVVLAFQAEARVTESLGRAARSLADATLSVLRLAFLSSAALEFFASLSVALLAVYCGFNLLGLLPFPVPEKLDLARAVFVLALAPEVYLPMRRLAAAYHDRQAAEAVADDLMAVGSTPLRRDLAPPPASDHPPAIRFRGVSVVYPGAGRSALENFDLDVATGEIIALVGPTGSGKTTVLNLLLGLAEPAAGVVTSDGLDLADHHLPRTAWASQAPVVTPGTLADNITLANRDAPPQAVAQAAWRVGLANEPDDLARPIDERGGGISGGERRRLALARAILRDAPLLLLDEPTAHLDAESEAALLPVIAAAARGRTTLIATHSDALAGLADRIVRLA